jgi:hypothetical protein
MRRRWAGASLQWAPPTLHCLIVIGDPLDSLTQTALLAGLHSPRLGPEDIVGSGSGALAKTRATLAASRNVGRNSVRRDYSYRALPPQGSKAAFRTRSWFTALTAGKKAVWWPDGWDPRLVSDEGRDECPSLRFSLESQATVLPELGYWSPFSKG